MSARGGTVARSIQLLNGRLIDESGTTVAVTGRGVRRGDNVGGIVPDAIPPISQYRLPFLADYDHGESGTDTIAPGIDLSKVWYRVQKPHNPGVAGPVRENSITIVGPTDVPGSGTYKPPGNVMKVNILPEKATPGVDPPDGDVNPEGNTNRAECYARFPPNASIVKPGNWPDPVGSTRWYAFCLYIPAGFPQNTTDAQWTDFTQWKGYAGGSPPQALEFKDGKIQLGGSHTRRNLVVGYATDHWYFFEIGFNWQKTTAGWVNIFVDGVEVLPKEQRATMDVNPDTGQADPCYLKQGIYRSGSWDVPMTLHFGPIKVAATRTEAATLALP